MYPEKKCRAIKVVIGHDCHSACLLVVNSNMLNMWTISTCLC